MFKDFHTCPNCGAAISGEKRNPELEIVIQLRGEEIIGQMNEFIEKRVLAIYEKYPYAKIRIEVLG